MLTVDAGVGEEASSRQVAEGGAEGKPAEAAAASGSSSSSTEQGTVRARRVDRKAEGASWSVLDNVRMTGDGTQLVRRSPPCSCRWRQQGALRPLSASRGELADSWFLERIR